MSSRRSIIKIIILGDSGVGKTALMHRYVNEHFEARYKATIGADFMTKHVELEDGSRVTLQIWDTAGEERFQSLGSAYFRGADACLVVFDVTQRDTFAHVGSWLEEFHIQSGQRDCVLVGNKTDQAEQRQVQARAAEAWCAAQGEEENAAAIAFFETSAKENVGVDEAFRAVIELVARRKAVEEQSVPRPQSVNLAAPPGAAGAGGAQGAGGTNTGASGGGGVAGGCAC